MDTEGLDATRLHEELADARSRIATLELELAQHREMLMVVFDSTPDLIVLKDRDSVYRLVNPAFCNFLGKSKEEILGKTDFELFPPEDAELYVKGDAEVMSTGKPESDDWEVAGASGRIWLQVIKTPVKNQNGEVAGVLCSVRDVSLRKQAEQELERIWNFIPDFVCIASVDGRLLKVNPAWEIHFGYRQEELLSTPFLDLIHPDDREATRKQVANKSIGAGAQYFLNRYRTKDGSYRWLEWNSTPVNGNLLYAIARDITSRVEQEKETRLWADAFRYCSHGIAIGLPSGNAILTCNEAYARMCRKTVREIEGVPIISMYVPEEHERVAGLLHDADRKGFVSYESRMVRSDGKIFPVQMEIVSISDDRGTPMYRIATVQDITERQNSQMALIESEVRFRSAVESAPEGIFIQTRGNFAYLNPAAMKMFGATTPGQLVGSPILDHVHPDFRKIIADRIRTINRDLLEVPLLEEKMLRLDGTSFDAEISAVPFVYDNWHGALVFMRDITERKLAEKERSGLEKQLVQSQKLESIGRLAGGVAHDLNNLLTPILGYSEILSRKFEPDDARRKNLKVMHDAALKARDLIRQLLAFSSSQALEFRMFDLNAVVRGFQPLLRRTIRANVEITYRFDEKELSMLGDAGQIEQIIMNLAINADDSMPSGGTLKIETSETIVEAGKKSIFEKMPDGHYVSLSVSDNGEGMDREIMSHVFEPFFTTKPKGKGTGLGLSTVYGIVKQHGGFIKVTSEPGQGSCFRIYFPMKTGEVCGTDPANESVSSGKNSGNVLVVEDDDLVRSFVEQSLQLEGFDVWSAASGEEALEMLAGKSCVPDLLLTDLVMKGINGKELVEKVVRLLPEIRVIYMSGYTNNIISNHGVTNKKFVFLQKPFTVKSLVEKVREMLKL